MGIEDSGKLSKLESLKSSLLFGLGIASAGGPEQRPLALRRSRGLPSQALASY